MGTATSHRPADFAFIEWSKMIFVLVKAIKKESHEGPVHLRELSCVSVFKLAKG